MLSGKEEQRQEEQLVVMSSLLEQMQTVQDMMDTMRAQIELLSGEAQDEGSSESRQASNLAPKQKSSMTRRLLTTKEASQILNLHTVTISRLAKAGYLPSTRVRGKGGGAQGQYRFEAKDLYEALESGKLREWVHQVRKNPHIKSDGDRGSATMISSYDAAESLGLPHRVILRLASNGSVDSEERQEERSDGEQGNVTYVNLEQVQDLLALWALEGELQGGITG